MTRRGRTGVKYEVDRALKEINRIGHSKKDARANGDKGYIHSYKQLEHDYSNSMEYGKWLRSERGKGLYQANKSDYRDYIAHKSVTCSKGHIINIETSLRHLSHGMNKISESRGRAPREWVPKDRIVSSRDRDKPSDRSYTHREVQLVREHLPSGSKAHSNLTLQNAFGLRLNESSKVKVAHFETRGNTTYFIAVGDRHASNTAKGVTKGGRPRETPCRPEYEKEVRALLSGKSSNQYVAGKYNTAKDAYRTAAEKAGVSYSGSHGYRHSYSRAQLNDRLNEKGIGKEGRQVIDRMLQNYDSGLRKDSGFTSKERNMYNAVNAIIDSVHADLGHGLGRLDLVAVYMR